MAVYEIEAPNGQILEIEGDKMPTEQELNEIFASVQAPQQPMQQEPMQEPQSDLQFSLGIAKNVLSGDLSANDATKQIAKRNLANREQWEQNHPYISALQKSLQPNYRGQVPQWELQAEYGLTPPIGERIKADIKTLGQNAVAPINLGLMALTGGSSSVPQLIGYGALQGATGAGLETLADKGLSKDMLPSIGGGALTGGLVGAIPAAVAKPFQTVIPKTASAITEAFTRVPTSYIQRATRPTSKALDIPIEEAPDMLADITSRVQSDYADILNTAGQKVGEATRNLPETINFTAKSLKDDIKKVLDSYSTSANEVLNVGRNNAKKYVNKINNLIDSATKGRESLTAPELHDLLKIIKNDVNWKEGDRKIANEVLERIYGKYSSRLKDLSPELTQANKEFARIADFQKKEGTNKILKSASRGNIDTASRTLRNYDSTVTKGNTKKNVQALEGLFNEYGKQPFLNTLDDLNVATLLNERLTTGDSTLNKIIRDTALMPALSAVRTVRQNIPNVNVPIKEITQGLKASAVPLLQMLMNPNTKY